MQTKNEELAQFIEKHDRSQKHFKWTSYALIGLLLLNAAVSAGTILFVIFTRS